MSQEAESFDRLFGIIKRLRAPDGCPWDREQTPQSTRANLIEEAYETIEAINDGDTPHVREELGDVSMVLLMMAYMYEQQDSFTVKDVFDEISEKLIRRHPHVFGDAEAADAAAVLTQWNVIKETVEGRPKKDSVLDEVSRALPPLERAYKLQKKAAKRGFDWTEISAVWAKLREEVDEAEEACTEARPGNQTDADHLEEEIGDLLFSVVNVSRSLHVDPSVALDRAAAKFSRRFKSVEKEMKARGIAMGTESFALMDRLWDEVKAAERETAKSVKTPTIDGGPVRG
jgi:tetrapyrrole methylase family protein / MazG family protein